jgi:hypothetical protein
MPEERDMLRLTSRGEAVTLCESKCSRVAPRDQVTENARVFRLTSRGA